MNTATQLKEAGQQRAAASAGPLWMTQALDFLRRYLRTQAKAGIYGGEFTFDDFHSWAAERGLPEPVSLNAWGALPRKAWRDGLCLPTPRAKAAKRRASHGRLVRVWRVAV